MLITVLVNLRCLKHSLCVYPFGPLCANVLSKSWCMAYPCNSQPQVLKNQRLTQFFFGNVTIHNDQISLGLDQFWVLFTLFRHGVQTAGELGVLPKGLVHNLLRQSSLNSPKITKSPGAKWDLLQNHCCIVQSLLGSS